ncbi:NAD(+)--dinitrogen-reductase ADP-D-ribosyltransferase [Ideonella oryzae]|uniref:NAD(+)--dinitrogen-reductase ADP-D-ribosyltransferase n=1 Tax=Ideonella oryzae TaxID=2937441 RepID=A0ABT1BNY3_9BURK|nr:NAD(+)--dinitrogen-reductase ADP-D-ribosyltransferase [Ideonella oryzae]MCO5977302.1 NAD(+)--dinitrogen-reductase ADP-D-ribosyltransferase [Ideonella oryzae]
MAEVDDEQPHRWYSTNLVGVPAPVLASVAFHAHPQALHIAGTREAHPGLFALLARADSLNEAREMFDHYLGTAFGLRKPDPAELARLGPAEQRRWRSSWRKLLQGWGMDANGPAGAVLKGWVESRFGLVPRFHRAPLGRFPSPAWVRYLEEKAASRYHNNNIHQQLDLLYEFCQWALARFGIPGHSAPGARHITLWRGTLLSEEQRVGPGPLRRPGTLRLNNLVSFSLDATEAGCFGDTVFRTALPACKLLVFPGLLPGQVLQGEQEVLALGGDVEVEIVHV